MTPSGIGRSTRAVAELVTESLAIVTERTRPVINACYGGRQSSSMRFRHSISYEKTAMDEAMDTFLLLQVRNADDPMRNQEIDCFARALGCASSQIEVFDLLAGVPTVQQLAQFDVVLLGGSGDYSVAEGGAWLAPILEAMRELYALSKPTFASCWGFQAFAKAMGGDVITDMDRAELGTLEVYLSEEGKHDPVFSPLGECFVAPMGHQDHVVRLPPGAVRLAYSDKTENQAFCFPGKPVYCTQFHPELNAAALLQRVQAYPKYVNTITGETLEEFKLRCRETPATDQLLGHFMKHALGENRE